MWPDSFCYSGIMLSTHALLLRIVHGLFALYFGFCIVYMFYAAAVQRFDTLLIICMVSLLLEGIAVHILNGGHCPLIHIQRRVGDDKPFFELFLPPYLAHLVIPAASVVALLGAVLVAVRYATAT